MSNAIDLGIIAAVIVGGYLYWSDLKTDCDSKNGELVRGVIGFVCVGENHGK